MKLPRILLYFVSILIMFVMVFPFFWAFLLSFKDSIEIFSHPISLPTNFNFHNYVVTFKSAHLANLFKNSLLLTIISVPFQLMMIYISSFAIARLDQRVKWMSKFYYYLFLAGMAVPVLILIQTFYNVTKSLGDIIPALGVDHLYGLLPIYIAGGIPFCTLMFVGAMRGFPIEMEEAAIIDGCNLWGVMFRVTLPLCMPVIGALFVFTVLASWNEFPVASILLSDNKNYTLPLALAFFKSQYSNDYGSMMRAIIMMLIPQLVFYVIFQRQIVDGIATDGIKG